MIRQRDESRPLVNIRSGRGVEVGSDGSNAKRIGTFGAKP
jgi:hypothetical protein